MSIRDDMKSAHLKAIVGYMQCGEPSPEMEWIMHPDSLADLRKACGVADCFLGQRHDGVFEFMLSEIRVSADQIGWQLKAKVCK